MAWADPDYFSGQTECGSDGSGPGCQVGAESGERNPGDAGRSGGDPSAGGNPGGGEAAAEAEPACEEVGAGAQECEAGFDQAGLSGDEPAVDPVEVANNARDSLVLPGPGMATSPGADAPVLVRVPVWLWVDDESWRSESAEAEVPGGSVSVTATPTVADWSMGDGSTVSCEGPGVPFTAGRDDPAAESPECGHTYTRASAGEPQGAYRVGVEVTWEVTWESSEGDGGELEPLVTSASEDLDVVESHGLVEDAG
ncbi:hypothetical protein [Murinocardiopsis flavida]|uniref:hypothetical protein n=1 Tax=Murinocardiopsis flavida TaxID=645275 RepID=UPI001FE6CBE7|nr:hypothetical protein [Murinocardiopsis flavida]